MTSSLSIAAASAAWKSAVASAAAANVPTDEPAAARGAGIRGRRGGAPASTSAALSVSCAASRMTWPRGLAVPAACCTAAAAAAAAAAVRTPADSPPTRDVRTARSIAAVAANAISGTSVPERAARPLSWERRCAATARACGMPLPAPTFSASTRRTGRPEATPPGALHAAIRPAPPALKRATASSADIADVRARSSSAASPPRAPLWSSTSVSPSSALSLLTAETSAAPPASSRAVMSLSPRSSLATANTMSGRRSPNADSPRSTKLFRPEEGGEGGSCCWLRWCCCCCSRRCWRRFALASCLDLFTTAHTAQSGPRPCEQSAISGGGDPGTSRHAEHSRADCGLISVHAGHAQWSARGGGGGCRGGCLSLPLRPPPPPPPEGPRQRIDLEMERRRRAACAGEHVMPPGRASSVQPAMRQRSRRAVRASMGTQCRAVATDSRSATSVQPGPHTTGQPTGRGARPISLL